MDLRIGCSSWTSEAWWGRVYPEGTAPGDRLARYARRFDTVEVDSSYYRDPGPFLVRRWARVTPESFRFTLKFPRELLDPKRGVDREGIAQFESHARELGPKLGALVLQFPPSASCDRAGTFLTELFPALDPTLRYAVELRSSSWYRGEVLERLERELTDRRFALVWSYLTYLDMPAVRTTDFVYLRFIGDHTSVPEAAHGELRIDRSAATRRWAENLKAVRGQLSFAFVFFNNHYAGFAPASVNEFRQEMGLAPVRFDPAPTATGPTLDEW